MGGALALIGAALTLSILSSQNHPVPQQLKHAIGDTMTPAVSTLSQPASLLDRFGTRIGDLMRLDEENKRLRNENAALLHWQIVARRLETENATLRGLLQMKTEVGARFVTAPVVVGTEASFRHALLLSAGRRDGIEKDQAVIAEEGLVGRIIDTANDSSHVLLITDINSRIPVEIVETGEKAILVGNNSTHPQLKFADDNAVPVKGQRVVTTADGGVFPAGFAVGEVQETGKAGTDVTPYVNASRLSFVRAVTSPQ